MALVKKDYDEIVNHTRLSSATYFDAAGGLRTAADDEPRFTHDPVTGERLGLLVEGSATNDLWPSEDFTDPNWAKTTTTIDPNVETAPNGTVTAGRATATGDFSRIVQNPALADNENVPYSIHAKEGTAWVFAVRLQDKSGSINEVEFDIRNKTATVRLGSATEMSVEELPDGYIRAKANFNASTGTSTPELRAIYRSTKTGGWGNGESIIIWGASTGQGSYIPTTTAPATRAPDVVSVGQVEKWLINNGGLLTGTFIFKLDITGFFPAILTDIAQFDNSTIKRFLFARNADNTFSTFDGTNRVTIGPISDKAKIVITANNGVISGAVNGVSAGDSGILNFGEISELSLSNFGRSPDIALISLIKILPYALTESEAIEASKL